MPLSCTEFGIGVAQQFDYLAFEKIQKHEEVKIEIERGIDGRTTDFHRRRCVVRLLPLGIQYIFLA